MDFSNIKTAEELLRLVHIRHGGQKDGCSSCVKLAAEFVEELEQLDILPRFGNLLFVLEEEANREKSELESKRSPSQNDLTRWALKDAVLAYYQGLNYPEDMPVVENRYNDRLITDLAPNFSAISNLWLERLDELKRRQDKYTLILEEFDKAENDLYDGMRGSAFEKQLDRYREEFMKKLMR
jgi:predicted outer membrane lipoprotein